MDAGEGLGWFARGQLVTGFPEKTVSDQNVYTRKPLKLNGSLLFATVFGGARPEGCPVTPLKTPVSFRFALNPKKTRA
jgi:hypothetical protein